MEQPVKRRLHVVKKVHLTEEQVAEPDATKLQHRTTLRDRFRSTISPFLLSIHIRVGDQTPDYEVVNQFHPSIPSHGPVQIYTWLDNKLSETISAVFDQNHEDVPDEWNTITISSLFVLKDQVNKQHILTMGPKTDDSSINWSLYEHKLEVGDHLEFHFE